MREGKAAPYEPLAAIRERARRERESLDPEVRALRAAPYDVRVHPELEELRATLARAR
jgi:hypothetical protein